MTHFILLLSISGASSLEEQRVVSVESTASEESGGTSERTGEQKHEGIYSGITT